MSLTLAVQNIHCEACAKRVTTAIQRAEPEATAEVDIASGRVTVEPGRDPAAIIASLDKAGYPAVAAG